MSAAVIEFDREGHCHLRVSLHVSLLALEVLSALAASHEQYKGQCGVGKVPSHWQKKQSATSLRPLATEPQISIGVCARVPH
jgi:hypothetical protein